MTDREFVAEIYNGLTMMYRGLGAILAAMAKRYALGKYTEHHLAAPLPPPPIDARKDIATVR